MSLARFSQGRYLNETIGDSIFLCEYFLIQGKKITKERRYEEKI